MSFRIQITKPSRPQDEPEIYFVVESDHQRSMQTMTGTTEIVVLLREAAYELGAILVKRAREAEVRAKVEAQMVGWEASK